MPEILVVCTANICRSPVVEAVLRDRLEARGLGDWKVASGGTLAMPGFAPAEFSIDVLAERGLDIRDQRSQRVGESQLASADLVLCMERSHKEALAIESPQHRHKIYLLTEMVGELEGVEDPIGGPRDWYEQMADHVTDLIDRGLPRIIELAGGRRAVQNGPRPAPPASGRGAGSEA